MTVKQAQLVQQQNLYAKVDMTTNTVTLYTGPVILVGIGWDSCQYRTRCQCL
jgi:hypothetical protein